MDENENDNFDIDASVDEIAQDLGFVGIDDDVDDVDEITLTDDDNKDGLQDEETETTEKVEAKQAPASWAKDQHENWAKVPKEAQDYIELREKQMLDGIEQYKQGANFAQHLAKVIEPFRQDLTDNGINEVEAIENLFQHNAALTRGPLESRQNAFVQLGQSLGLMPSEQGQQIDPRTAELQQRLDRIERQEKAREQQTYQSNYEKTSQDVAAFAADPANVHFDEVADDIVLHLQAGMDLKAAYDRAVWSNPITRAKEIAKSVEDRTKELTQKQKTAAVAAKKASSTNVRQISTNKTAKEPIGSWEDTMSETLERIKNSN